MILSEIYIYPVKSLGGISLNEVEVTDRGLKYDRRWMLIDENKNFITQRKFPQMALINCELRMENLEFVHKINNERFSVGLTEHSENIIEAIVWEDKVEVFSINNDVDKWFTKILGINCSLVYMPEETKRLVDTNYASHNEVTSLSDGYPFLIIGQASLDELNSKLVEKVSINRFRPNFVFTGGAPFEEDKMNSFSINDVRFHGVKQCGRCVITTIDQITAVKSDEPLKTLASYRTINNKVMFGMNLIHSGKGFVKVGDRLTSIEYK